MGHRVSTLESRQWSGMAIGDGVVFFFFFFFFFFFRTQGWKGKKRQGKGKARKAFKELYRLSMGRSCSLIYLL